MKNIRNNYPVVLRNETLDKDIQSMFLPLNLMQYIMFCPKYRIKDDYIISNSLTSNIVSMIGTLAFILLFVYRTYMQCCNNDCLGCNTFLYLTVYFDSIFYSLGFVINFVIGVKHSEKFVKFVTTFQKVHRFLNNESSFKNFIICNWVIVIGFLCGYSSIFTTFAIRQSSPTYTVICLNLLIGIDLNIIYASRIIELLKNKVVLWNSNALNSYNLESMQGKNFDSKIFQAYVDILECYDIYKVCFEHFILYHIIEALVHALVYTQVSLEISKTGNMNDDVIGAALLSLPLLCWMIKDLSWQNILSVQCEKFYSAIQNVQESCALILKSNCSGEEKKICKNVLRLHRASFSKIRVCSLFYIDAALQLSLISLVINYAVVLLQFALL